MRKYLILILIIILCSCISNKEKVINPLDENALSRIEEVDALFFEYSLNNEELLIEEASSIIEELKVRAENNKEFEAIVLAEELKLNLLTNMKVKTEKIMGEIEKRNKNEERLFLIKADLEKDEVKKEIILKEGIDSTENNLLLKISLANLYYLKGEFNKALVVFDEIYNKLPDNLKKIFKNTRDLSYKFVRKPPKNTDILDIIIKEKISFEDVIRMMLSEVGSLPKNSFNPEKTIEENYKRLELLSYIHPLFVREYTIKTEVKRKDFSYFLLSFISELERDTFLKIKYTKTGIKESPIPDINFDDYYYNSALIVVERELMELPDGENFYPEEYVNGIELYETVKEIDGMY